jgi:hypothetical protein
MAKAVTALLLALLFALPLAAASQDAVVQIPSHGCSGTVIATAPNRSLVLTCAHAWEQARDRGTQIRIEAPGVNISLFRSRPRLIGLDRRRDLALIELGYGPFPRYYRVAPRGYGYGLRRRCYYSIGFDGMRQPVTLRHVTVLGSQGAITFTREQPRHGRSGGALVVSDGQVSYLIGVVQGFEVMGQGRGMYASHEAILAFLAESRVPSAYTPDVHEEREVSR